MHRRLFNLHLICLQENERDTVIVGGRMSEASVLQQPQSIDCYYSLLGFHSFGKFAQINKQAS